MPPDSRNNRREAAQTGNDRSRTGYVRALHEHTRKSSSGSCYGPQARKIDAGAALMYFEQAETRFDIPGIDAAMVCLEHGRSAARRSGKECVRKRSSGWAAS